jgi:hypothetical protein
LGAVLPHTENVGGRFTLQKKGFQTLLEKRLAGFMEILCSYHLREKLLRVRYFLYNVKL